MNMNTGTDNDLCRIILEAIVRHGIFNTFINEIPTRIYIKDAQSRFVAANKAVLDFLGVKSPEKVIGRTDFDFYPKEQARKYFDDEHEIVRSGKHLLHKEEPNQDMTGF